MTMGRVAEVWEEEGERGAPLAPPPGAGWPPSVLETEVGGELCCGVSTVLL